MIHRCSNVHWNAIPADVIRPEARQVTVVIAWNRPKRWKERAENRDSKGLDARKLESAGTA